MVNSWVFVALTGVVRYIVILLVQFHNKENYVIAILSVQYIFGKNIQLSIYVLLFNSTETGKMFLIGNLSIMYLRV